MKCLIYLLFLSVFCSQNFSAQTVEISNSNYDRKKIKPETCELNNINLEQADTKAEEDYKLIGRGESIILIARAGTKDKKNNLNILLERRLYTARAYLSDYLKKREKETIITAIAPNEGSEYGIIEIYVSGSLFHVLASNPNYGISVGSCDSDASDDAESRTKRALLYPWQYKKSFKK